MTLINADFWRTLLDQTTTDVISPWHWPNFTNKGTYYPFAQNGKYILEEVSFYISTSLTSACFGTFWASIFNFWHYSVWLRITDEGSVTELRIWSILLIKSDLKWCMHLSTSLFLYSWWVSLLVDQWVTEGTCSQVLRSTSVD